MVAMVKKRMESLMEKIMTNAKDVNEKDAKKLVKLHGDDLKIKEKKGHYSVEVEGITPLSDPKDI